MTISIIIDEISKNLKQVLDELEYPKVEFSVELSKSGFGDIMCNVSFLLSKTLKQNPKVISDTIVEKYKNFLGKFVSNVEAHPSGYLNFFLKMSQVSELIIKNSIKENYGSIDLGQGTKVIVEHTSVNPNKALHIGHVRNVVIGDTIARILERTNHTVSILNYVDDSGLQVADIIVGFRHLGFSEIPPSDKKFDQYCGDEVYVKTTDTYLEKPELETTRKDILKQIEEGESEIANFAFTITEKVLECQLETCWRLGVNYDCLNFESQIIRSGLWQEIFEKLKKLGVIELDNEGKNQGCWVIKNLENEEDKVLVRSNGTATYIAKDIPYAAWKLSLVKDPFNYKKYQSSNQKQRILWRTTLEKSTETKQNFGSEKVITVIDSRQTRLQKIITKLMSQLQSKDVSYLHLAYESVTLSADTANQLGIDTKGKHTQMSGRKGLYVNADSVLDLLENKIISETKKRNPDLKSEKVMSIAKDVAVGTLRYEMIKQDLDRIITFDLSKSLSLEGDTASYIQYTYARASRILEKSTHKPDFNAAYNRLLDEFEIKLIKLIGMFEIPIRDSAKNLAPKIIAKYCHDLSVAFNSFYEHNKVLNLDDDDLENARLCLVHSYRNTLKSGLELLGINTPDRM